MSRSGYSNGDYGDYPQLAYGRYRQAVKRSLQGKRGQAFLIEMKAALDALPTQELHAGEFECEGTYCALGAVAKARGMDVSDLDPEDAVSVADRFGIADSMVREITYINDESLWGDLLRRDLLRRKDSMRLRWIAVNEWLLQNIKVTSV